MATLIDYVRHYHASPNRYNLRANAIAILHSLLEEFNRARFPDVLTIRTSYLMNAAGIDKQSTFYDARNALIQYGFITANTKRNCPYADYSLAILPNSNREQPVLSSGICRSYRSTLRDGETRPRTRKETVNYED